MKRWAFMVAWASLAATAAWGDPARVTAMPPPEYPAWARGTGICTEVELRVLVGGDGRARHIEVVPYSVRHDFLTRSLRASFDSAAVRSVRGWSFTPATQAGKRMVAWLTVHVPFADPTVH